MNLSLDDFNALSAEMSGRDVKIAQLEMKMAAERLEHQREKEALVAERDAVDRVRSFFAHIRNIELLSAIKSFVLEVLPENATPEQIAFATKTMELPKDDGLPAMMHVDGDYNDIHDNGGDEIETREFSNVNIWNNEW